MSTNIDCKILCFLLLSLSPFLSKALVPTESQFKFTNEGFFGASQVEYNGNYRQIYPINSYPFQLCFFNTTSNSYTLALGMGSTGVADLLLYRWVWEANRNHPVKENATLSFGGDGNLILTDADGTIAWETNTANKGGVGLKLMENGNLVIYDSKGKFIWESFDYPSDSLLVGQSIKVGSKIVSAINGAYSFVSEPNGLNLYYTTKISVKKPFLYFSDETWNLFQPYSDRLILASKPEGETGSYYSINIIYHSNLPEYTPPPELSLAFPKYNSTFSFLRIDVDGNLRVYTFYDKVFQKLWQETFTLFSKTSIYWDECRLPEHCGRFGICDSKNQFCVACPLPSGLMGWSENCAPAKVACDAREFHYYKVEGVDHLASKFNKGQSMKTSDCVKKCSSDCKCMGYFYNTETLKCWIAYDLMTLIKTDNSTHVGYIKTPNKQSNGWYALKN